MLMRRVARCGAHFAPALAKFNHLAADKGFDFPRRAIFSGIKLKIERAAWIKVTAQTSSLTAEFLHPAGKFILPERSSRLGWNAWDCG